MWLLLTLIFSASISISAESRGTVIKSLKFKSEILSQNIHYSVYLPPGYQKDMNRYYPVFYLLHGFTDNENAWIEKGWVDIAADRGIQVQRIQRMIIVMPYGGLKWFVNQPDGKYNYEDMFIKEFIPYIDKKYRTKKERKFRAVGGLSMGGYGALGYAMRHSGLFSMCISFSAAIRPDEETITLSQEDFDYLYKPLYGENIQGYKRLSPHWVKNNPIRLAQNMLKEKLSSIRWYISCGDDDDLVNGNSTLHNIFRKRKIEHEYRVYNGGHNWEYWRSYIAEGLEFISAELKENK